MSLNGIRTVARLELLQRARGARWYLALAGWLLAVGGIALLTWKGVQASAEGSDLPSLPGAVTFDVVVFFVLGLALLVTPALTATSVNGDRDQGVLATLQTTLLTPADIVLGKLLASFAVAMTFLAATLPFLAPGLISGDVSLLSSMRLLLVLAVVLLGVCAIGLMLSTLVSRPVGSAVLTYLTIAATAFLTVIVFVMALYLVSRPREVTVYGEDPAVTESEEALSTEPRCTEYKDTRAVPRTDLVWPLLAANPFVVVADAAPSATDDRSAGFTPLALISTFTRAAKAGPPDGPVKECWSEMSSAEEDLVAQARRESPVWPYGLAVWALAGAAATWVAIRRVRTPIRRLPKGTRIA